VVSLQAAVIAALLAITDRRAAVLPVVALAVGYVALHAISNLSNDLVGYRRGHDSPDSPRRHYTPHPIADGLVSVRTVRIALAALCVVAVAAAIYFVWLRGWPVVVLALIGAAILYGYDAAPRTLKEIGLGELATAIV